MNTFHTDSPVTNASYPLGATCVGPATNFAVFSSVAARVTLCLFNGPEERVIPMTGASDGVWRVMVPGVGPGQPYGFRVEGPYAPPEGLRCNPAKLLLDPYARLMSGLVPADSVLRGEDGADPSRPDLRDSGRVMPKCIVVDERFDWGDDRPPRTAWADTVIYECHVKGLTKLHSALDPPLRGTYLGLASKAIIEHLLRLGVTAVELLPVQYFATEPRLAALGLVNYWGYNSIGFFAPDPRYATVPPKAIDEFRIMVRELHRAGIEVILDVVYNHTAEGDHSGPTLSFRGLDNRAYYLLEPGAADRYVNHSACGNTINALHPRTQQLIMDSLRYWVQQMHVDGFRFDLAPVLCREAGGVDPALRFFNAVLQDPLLGRVKLLVEPWDAGPQGCCLGRFPRGIREWNGRYRDCVRKFWRGDEGQLAEFVSRLAGSSDIFWSRTTPLAGVNYVTCHDGSTLHDLVSYKAKHNEANGESNRDGPPDNFADNHGVEGPTEDPGILAARERTKRNLLATLAFSQGVPMLTAGDEMGRTQVGNDNAYCQDNAISWVNWNLDAAQREHLEFVRRVLAARREYPALRRDSFFDGRSDLGLQDVVWLDEHGRELSAGEWQDPHRRTFSMMIRQESKRENVKTSPSQNGALAEQTLLLLVNASSGTKVFKLPIGLSWRVAVSTERDVESKIVEGEFCAVEKSLVLLVSQA